MNPSLSISKSAPAEFCRRHGIGRLYVFGSALNGDFGPESNIDLLVEFEPDRIPGLPGIAGMEVELSGMLSGHGLDIRTPEVLSRYLWREVPDTAEVQHDQG